MLDLTTQRDRIIAATLRLAETRNWRDITLNDIAEEANIPLSDLADDFSSKSAILLAFVRAVDKAILDGAPKPEEGQDPRDRVFEVVMNRFDLLKPYKNALKRIMWSRPIEPKLLRKLLSSQHWMLEAAGVSSEGPLGLVKVGGLAGVYSRVFRIWLSDDDPGLGRTMAALDKRLRRGEDALSRLNAICEASHMLACALAPRGLRGWSSCRPREREEETPDTPDPAAPVTT